MKVKTTGIRAKIFCCTGSGGVGFIFICAHMERSEEHTSELQSRENLVCRLLLEKKKHCEPVVRAEPTIRTRRQPRINVNPATRAAAYSRIDTSAAPVVSLDLTAMSGVQEYDCRS